MEALILIYNSFLNILFSIPVVLSLLVFKRTKNKGYLFVAILYTAFCLDDIVIYMTEFIDWFAEFYKNILFVAPTFKTIIYLLTFFCMIKIVEWILPSVSQVPLYVCLAVLIIFLLFVPLMKNGSLELWLYYTASSVYGIIIGVYGLSRYKKISDKNHARLKSSFKKALIVVVVMFAIVIVEDTITLFNPASAFYRNTRSFSEDIMRIILTFITINYLNDNVFVYVDESIQTSDEFENNYNEEPNEPGDSYSKFYLFCREYGLTTREQDILALLLENKSNEEISGELIIALGTAKTHIHNIYEKLGVNKRKFLIERYEEFSHTE